jgi:Tfp pilus assembly protein PilF
MSTDPVVIALRAALAGGDNVQVRVALGRRLLELGQGAEALQEFERAIALEPANRDALAEAARAAGTAGDTARAQAYQLALAAASGSAPRPAAS